jgi:triosephosphate isomerase
MCKGCTGTDKRVFGQFSRRHTIGVGVLPVHVPPTGRRFFVAGNWKCNGVGETVEGLVGELNGVEWDGDVEVVVCPPFCYLGQVVGTLVAEVQVGAQDCWRGEGGAFTGEVSADQLVDVGARWVVAGHAERRRVLGETSAVVALKCAYALSAGLRVIVAVGESLEQNRAMDAIAEQLQALASKVADWSKVVLAYEPGHPCSPEQAQATHLAIREWIKKNTSEDVASNLRIIHGASVSPSSSLELAKQPDIDGFFVGITAAWNPKDFAAITNSVKIKKVTSSHLTFATIPKSTCSHMTLTGKSSLELQNIDFAVEQMMSFGEEPEPPWPEFLEEMVKVRKAWRILFFRFQFVLHEVRVFVCFGRVAQLRALAMKRFSTSLFEEECIEGYRANLEGKYDNVRILCSFQFSSYVAEVCFI